LWPYMEAGPRANTRTHAQILPPLPSNHVSSF
jgi:hypothetical protein